MDTTPGNRLADATSPYLLQHAGNPVHWWPWCAEAFAEARRRDVPVLISIGYSACHWCHVMAHESFEDEATARLMNSHFVNIKVDREERPDVDAVYMEATQAMTGHGGWPTTVFATGEGHPFYCGTYFPTEHFQRLLLGIAQAWQKEREAVIAQGATVVRALTERSLELTGPMPDTATLAQAVSVLRQSYDSVHGGFGDAPKFPPSMVLEFLLRHHARTGEAGALAMAERTLDAMARGGMYDQLGGGFARYSVDAEWIVPHFEKMLYDNALLLRVYTHAWRATGWPLARRVAEETARFLLTDLRTSEGGFASALDADSEGEEGKFYVWTPAELRQVLGVLDGSWAAQLFGVTTAGTFEHGRSVLQLRADPDDADRYERVRRALYQARAARMPPGRDDKVVAAWNGLAIAALSEAGACFEADEFVRAARQAGELIERVHLRDGRLVRVSRDGQAGEHPGVLEDYANVADGLIALYGVTGEPRWVRLAGSLLDAVLTHFADETGGFHDTADDAERLFRRPQDPTDSATPSGWFAAAGALLSYAGLTGSASHRKAAEHALGAVSRLAATHPRFVGWGLAVAEAAVAGPVEIAIVGARDDPRTAELHRAAFLADTSGAVIAIGEPSANGVPLLVGRGLVDGAPAAYVCRNFTCQAPVTTPEQLRAALSSSGQRLQQ